LEPLFTQYNAQPPSALQEIYTSFLADGAMLSMLIDERPPVVSFHFGLPSPAAIQALQNAGVFLLATATNLAEAKAIHTAGVDAIVAQGYEAGGHRGMFDLAIKDECLGTLALTRLLAGGSPIPIIAAGGIMDGAGIVAALALGASAAQLGTAFIACPESLADAGYRSALTNPSARHTVMTSAISGRPARSLANKFTALGETIDQSVIPAYPVAYDAGKSLHSAAKKTGEFGYGTQWAGQAAALSRSLPAAELMNRLRLEINEAIATSMPKLP
jgi:nitronate monooxygenase